MKFKLYINYYVDKNLERQKEIIKCFESNLQNIEIDKLYVIINENDINHFNSKISTPDNSKVVLVKINNRPTFNDFFIITQKYSEDNDLSAIINTDIILPEETIKKIKSWHWSQNYCITLCRYDITNVETLDNKFLNRKDSQDTWIVKGKFKTVPNADFTLGILGCDNKIAYYLNEIYNLINPSLDLVTLHLHLSKIRNYNMSERIERPYYLLEPTKLSTN